jgi:hypothetical protein
MISCRVCTCLWPWFSSNTVGVSRDGRGIPPLGDGSNYSGAARQLLPALLFAIGFDNLEAAEAVYPFTLVEHIERWLRESEEHYHEDEALAHDDEDDDDIQVTVAYATDDDDITVACAPDDDDAPAQY